MTCEDLQCGQFGECQEGGPMADAICVCDFGYELNEASDRCILDQDCIVLKKLDCRQRFDGFPGVAPRTASRTCASPPCSSVKTARRPMTAKAATAASIRTIRRRFKPCVGPRSSQAMPAARRRCARRAPTAPTSAWARSRSSGPARPTTSASPGSAAPMPTTRMCASKAASATSRGNRRCSSASRSQSGER